MDFLNKGITFYLALFIGLTLLPVFLDLADDAVIAFNTTIVAVSSDYLTIGNTLITVVRLAPYGVLVAVVAVIMAWVKSSLSKKGF